MATRSDRNRDEAGRRDDGRRWQQFIFDDITLILVLGLVVPTIFYIVLGLIDLTTVPEFQP